MPLVPPGPPLLPPPDPDQVLVCIEHTGAALVDHPVAVLVDSETWIDQGLLDSDCDDLRVFDLAGDDLAFWIEDGTCNTRQTRVWVSLPVVSAGPTSVVLELGGNPSGSGSDGEDVFPLLFDDFDGSFPGSTWVEIGDGASWQADGVLYTDGTKAFWSVDPVFSADDTALVVRLDAVAGYDDDVEIGGGVISGDLSSDELWSGDRFWYGFGHVSYTDAYFNTVPGASFDQVCTHDLYNGQPWLPVLGVDSRRWTRVEVTYDSGGGSRLVTDDGVNVHRQSDPSCAPTSPLPALVVTDHRWAGTSHVQEVDFVLVRPTAPDEPIAEVIEDEDADADGVPSWAEGCDDGNGDGIPAHADPQEPEATTTTTPTTTTTTTTPTTTTTTPTTTTTTPTAPTSTTTAPTTITTPTTTSNSDSTPGTDTTDPGSTIPTDDDRTPPSGASAVDPIAGCGCSPTGSGDVRGFWMVLGLAWFGRRSRVPAGR